MDSSLESNGSYTITLTRYKNFVGSMVAFSVYIDDVLVGKIKNGETININVTGGEHVITINKKNPVSLNITDNVSADVIILSAGSFGISNIKMNGVVINNSVNQDYNNTDKQVLANANYVFFASIILPIISLLGAITIKIRLKEWIYAITIGYAIVNIVGLKNIDGDYKKTAMLKNVVSIVLSLIAIVLSVVLFGI